MPSTTKRAARKPALKAPKAPKIESPLLSMAMLVRLKISTWSGRKFDRDTTSQIHSVNNATEEAGRYTKHMVSRAALKAITQTSNDAREAHYRLTLPWDNSGTRLLPVTVYDDYKETMLKFEEELMLRRNHFVDNFKEIVAQAQEDLGRLFDPADYPTADEVNRKISMDYEVVPVPDVTHFMVDLAEGEVAAIRDDLRRQVEGKIRGAVGDLFQRVGEAVKACADRLTETDGKQKIFRDSMLENLRDIVAIAPRLNITDDAALKDLVARVSAAIEGVEPDHLRPKSPNYRPESRAKLRNEMADLKTKFSGAFGEVV